MFKTRSRSAQIAHAHMMWRHGRALHGRRIYAGRQPLMPSVVGKAIARLFELPPRRDQLTTSLYHLSLKTLVHITTSIHRRVRLLASSPSSYSSPSSSYSSPSFPS